MQFFDGWRALNERCDKGDLTALTQLVGYKLLYLFDEQRFPERLPLSDRELMKRTGIQSGRTIVEARRRLKNAGLIDFETQAGKVTTYRWTGKHRGSTEEAVGKQSVSGGGTSQIRVHETPVPLFPYTIDYAERARVEEAVEAAAEYWAAMGGGRLNVEHLSQIGVWQNRHGLAWVKEAMQAACDANQSPRGVSFNLLRAVATRLEGGKKCERDDANGGYRIPAGDENEPWANY